MGTVSISTLSKAVHTACAAAASLRRDEDHTQLTGSARETPEIKTWPASGGPAAEVTPGGAGGTHLMTLGSSPDAHALETLVIHVDVFAHQRGLLAENIAQMVDTVDEIAAILTGQRCPYFGRPEITSFDWRWEVVTHTIPGPQARQYSGARFYITLEVGQIG